MWHDSNYMKIYIDYLISTPDYRLNTIDKLQM